MTKISKLPKFKDKFYETEDGPVGTRKCRRYRQLKNQVSRRARARNRG